MEKMIGILLLGLFLALLLFLLIFFKLQALQKARLKSIDFSTHCIKS